MAKQALSLEVPDTLNSCVLRVIDTSVYDEDLPIDCPTLWITPPGFFQSYSDTSIVPGFTSNLTNCDLGIQVDNCGTLITNFVDGIYVIKYSIAPHDKVYVEYNHLRITKALNLINKILCCLDINGCEPDAVTKAKIREVQFYYTMIKGAKAKVEYCHQPTKGMEIYNYAYKMLLKLSCGCGCGCDDNC